MTAPPFAYFGGKTQLAARIAALLPAHHALLSCEASVVLSGYPSPLYDDALTHWDRVTFATGTGQASRGVWSTRTEVLWSNRPLGEQPGLWDQEVQA